MNSNGKVKFLYWIAGITIALVAVIWDMNLQANTEKNREQDAKIASHDIAISATKTNIALICQALDVKGCKP